MTSNRSIFRLSRLSLLASVLYIEGNLRIQSSALDRTGHRIRSCVINTKSSAFSPSIKCVYPVMVSGWSNSAEISRRYSDHVSSPPVNQEEFTPQMVTLSTGCLDKETRTRNFHSESVAWVAECRQWYAGVMSKWMEFLSRILMKNYFRSCDKTGCPNEPSERERYLQCLREQYHPAENSPLAKVAIKS